MGEDQAWTCDDVDSRDGLLQQCQSLSSLPCQGDSTARDVPLSTNDNNTQELQTDSCLISLEGYCSKGIYVGFSAKKTYAEIPPPHTYIYVFLLETEKTPSSRKALHCY